MPWTDTTPSLPFQGNSMIARHNGRKAAIAAAPARGRKSAEYLAWLGKVGQATDQGSAECLGWPLSSICSIRNGLMARGQVRAVGSQMGRYGCMVTLYAVR